jgi:serine/threonine-protein kinase
MTEPPDDHTGDVLPSRYRDPVMIGTGGMGAVYRAHDERLGRTVAVKVQTADVRDEEVFRARFRREAMSAARIHHPHVATIYDVGEHGGVPYLVMEYVPGGTLEERLAEGRPSLAQALDWISQAADALDAAHAAGVVHRDVKPANLLLDADGSVKIADFGIARLVEDAGSGLTATGTVLGSSGYTSPEQAQGLPVTPAGDVYSLAAVAYELLTGERPYAGRTGIAELTAHVSAPVPDASARRPDLPPGIGAVLARGLAKDPADRHRRARSLAAALRAAAAAPEGVTAVQPLLAGGVEEGRGRARPRWPVAVAVAIALFAAATIAGMIAAGGDGDEPAGAVATRTTTRTTTEAAPETPPRTVVETVTQEVPVAPAPDEPAPEEPSTAGAPTIDEAVALTDESTAALEDGDSEGGLALAERALLALADTGEPYEGNARYNRGRALIDLGRCDEAVPHLERSVAVGGSDWQLGVRRAALEEARACGAR